MLWIISDAVTVELPVVQLHGRHHHKRLQPYARAIDAGNVEHVMSRRLGRNPVPFIGTGNLPTSGMRTDLQVIVGIRRGNRNGFAGHGKHSKFPVTDRQTFHFHAEAGTVGIEMGQ